MSLSEFRYNKKRKHYAYIFKAMGIYRKCILFSTKPTRVWKNKTKKNIKLFRHPNKKCLKTIYLIPIVHVDSKNCFDIKLYLWSFDKNDKRLIKRIKKMSKRKPASELTSIKTGGSAGTLI